MWAVPGIVVLIALIVVRPQEFTHVLSGVPWLHIMLGVAIAGWCVDLAIGRTSVRRTPLTTWTLLLLAWCCVTVVVKSGDIATLNRLMICVVLGLLIGHGVQTLGALETVATTLVICAIVLSLVGLHQKMSPKGCLVADEVDFVPSNGVPDGRPCANRVDCFGPDAEPNRDYLCEHIGAFGTTSVADGRVRYRGALEDPNELADYLAMSLPLAFALRRRKRSTVRLVLMAAAMLLIMAVIVLTGSRSGQLAVLAVLGAYFISGAGIRGAVVAGVFAIPALLYGGREGLSASASTIERMECWSAAIEMFRDSPMLGVGYGQFLDHHYLTAHNAFLLALGELGVIGMFLFAGMMYVAVRIPLTVLRHLPHGKGKPDPRRTWALAILAAMCGLLTGSVFLSLTYHYMLWIFVGLSAALNSIVQRSDRTFKLELGWRDYSAIGALSVSLIVVVAVSTRMLGV